MGELIAWIIGWDLILEYGVSVAAVAVGWGGYFKELLDSLLGITLPDSIALPPGDGGNVNLPAVFIVLAVTAVLIAGVRQSARTNTIMVAIKLAVLALFIALGVTAFESGNLSPFAPNGFTGVVDAAALIFFAYIGFDAVSTGSEECREPRRDLPIAIIGSLTIATLLYIIVAVVAAGALPFEQLQGDESPLATVLDKGAGLSWGADMISFGALVAITSVVLTILFGQVRIMYSMSRDGLVPARLGEISERTRTPVLLTAMFGTLIAIVAALVPLEEIAKLVNIGTLFAFVLVNIGVIVLRRTKPDLDRGFRVPLVPWFPLIGAALCIFLMKYLDGLTWLRFAVWLVIGLAIYALYGFRHSKLRSEA
jgi:APA family basic amino acid/polyamine antiporter